MVDLVILAALVAAAYWALTERRRWRVRPARDGQSTREEVSTPSLMVRSLRTAVGAWRTRDAAADEPPEIEQAGAGPSPQPRQTGWTEVHPPVAEEAGGAPVQPVASPPSTLLGSLLGLAREWLAEAPADASEPTARSRVAAPS